MHRDVGLERMWDFERFAKTKNFKQDIVSRISDVTKQNNVNKHEILISSRILLNNYHPVHAPLHQLSLIFGEKKAFNSLHDMFLILGGHNLYMYYCVFV